VATTDRLAPDAPYDLVLVPVRVDQLESVFPSLAASHATPNVLFFGNDARGPSAQVAALGRARVMLGFAGAGGCVDGGVVHYLIIRDQRTTLGELDGMRTSRITAAAGALRGGGFSVAVSPDISGWLTTHAAFVTCIAAAIYVVGGDATRLASERELLHLMVRATREAFDALRKVGVRELPLNLRVLYGVMPAAFAVRYWQRALVTPLGAFGLAAHANAARPEMTLLAAQLVERLRASSRPAPALERLFARAGLGGYATTDPVRP
jgi:2-dehydropantoate 2-reductase